MHVAVGDCRVIDLKGVHKHPSPDAMLGIVLALLPAVDKSCLTFFDLRLQVCLQIEKMSRRRPREHVVHEEGRARDLVPQLPSSWVDILQNRVISRPQVDVATDSRKSPFSPKQQECVSASFPRPHDPDRLPWRVWTHTAMLIPTYQYMGSLQSRV